MIDEDIIAAAKRIILKNSRKEEKIDLDSKSEDANETRRKIELLFDMIQEQNKHLRGIEQKLDTLVASK